MLGKSYQHSLSMPVLNRHGKTNFNIKLAIIGNSSVGKSSLVERVVNDSFNDNGESTIGAAYISFYHKQNSKIYKFQMWDTAGQERFKSLVPMYIKGSIIILIVFDIANRCSFDDVTSYWYNDAAKHAPDATKILIGSKLDFISNRSVSTRDASRFAENNGMEYIECSAKSGENITQIKNLIVKTGVDLVELYNVDIIADTLERDNIVRLGEEDPTMINRFRSNCIDGYCGL